MNKVTERFIKAYKSLGLTGYKMGKEIEGITSQKISHINTGRVDVSLDIIESFCIHYSQIDANWLLTGNGEMYKGKQEARIINIKEIEDREGSSEEETPSTGIFPGSNLNKRSMKDVNQKNLRILIERIFELEEENESLKKKLGISESQSVS
ncbi:hypothetical protein ACGE0T_14000 [Parabacteroides sp. APC149_11_2_Y6]